MVKVKGETKKNWLESYEEELTERRKKNPIITTRWFVVEITPPVRYATGDGHGGTDWDWTYESREVVSPMFQHEYQVKAWVEQHEPDDGKKLEINRENLREFTERKWVSW